MPQCGDAADATQQPQRLTWLSISSGTRHRALDGVLCLRAPSHAAVHQLVKSQRLPAPATNFPVSFSRFQSLRRPSPQCLQNFD